MAFVRAALPPPPPPPSTRVAGISGVLTWRSEVLPSRPCAAYCRHFCKSVSCGRGLRKRIKSGRNLGGSRGKCFLADPGIEVSVFECD